MLRILTSSLLSLAVLTLFTGCPGGDTETTTYNDAEQNEGHDDHHHHEAGPHGGHIVELTEDESAHLEVTMGEDRTITLYILGDDVETAVPVKVGDVIFELEGEDDSETELEVTAMPLEGEPEGMSSVFVVKGDKVPEAITDIEKLHGHVHVTIDGVEYEGELEHDHHDHEDGDDDGDDADDSKETKDTPAGE